MFGTAGVFSCHPEQDSIQRATKVAPQENHIAPSPPTAGLRGEVSIQLGTVREVVLRTLRTLKEAKVIGLSGRWIEVLDGVELRRIAGANQ